MHTQERGTIKGETQEERRGISASTSGNAHRLSVNRKIDLLVNMRRNYNVYMAKLLRGFHVFNACPTISCPKLPQSGNLPSLTHKLPHRHHL